jgi:hypothetical protein
MQVIDQEKQSRVTGGGPDEDTGQFLIDPAETERTLGELLADTGQERADERDRIQQLGCGPGQRPPDLIRSAAEIGRERFLQRQEGFGAPAQAPDSDNGHPAVAGLRCRLGSEPWFADTWLAENQDGMSFAGFGYPGNVLAQQVALELPVDQWFLRAVVACVGDVAAVVIRWSHSKLPPRGAAAHAP